MSEKSMFNRYVLYRRHRLKLDKLPCEFFSGEANKVGLALGDLQALKNRGVLSYRKISNKEGTWKKKECS